jgi:hypothetical protein
MKLRLYWTSFAFQTKWWNEWDLFSPCPKTVHHTYFCGLTTFTSQAAGAKIVSVDNEEASVERKWKCIRNWGPGLRVATDTWWVLWYH